MNLTELDQGKIARCKNGLLERYYENSIVEKVVDAIDFNEAVHANLDFSKFVRWHLIPRDWFTDPSIYPDMVFSSIGRGIAIGEEKYIVNTILASNNTERTELETVTCNDVVEAVTSLVSRIGKPISSLQLSMFAPVEYFVTVYTRWVKEGSLRILKGTTDLAVNDIRVKLLWSSKYVGYKEFILTERTLCRWIAKPNINSRLEAYIAESEKPGEMEVKASQWINTFGFIGK